MRDMFREGMRYQQLISRIDDIFNTIDKSDNKAKGIILFSGLALEILKEFEYFPNNKDYYPFVQEPFHQSYVRKIRACLSLNNYQTFKDNEELNAEIAERGQ